MYIRQTKNDSVDSFIIAQIMSFDEYSPTGLAEKKHYCSSPVFKLKAAAKGTFGIDFAKDAFSFQIKQLILIASLTL